MKYLRQILLDGADATLDRGQAAVAESRNLIKRPLFHHSQHPCHAVVGSNAIQRFKHLLQESLFVGVEPCGANVFGRPLIVVDMKQSAKPPALEPSGGEPHRDLRKPRTRSGWVAQ
jgi:hypothetical protein